MPPAARATLLKVRSPLPMALTGVHAAKNAVQPGQCILIRGRRRVGKSSLVEEFLRQADVPYLFFTAAGRSAQDELAELIDVVAASDLPARDLFAEETPSQWNAALRLLAEILPDDEPSVLVIDEVPYLMDRIDAFEGVLQRAWDRLLSRKPVLLLLVGSDLSMMEALNSYERPFHQRGREMVVGPLNPADLAEMLELEPAAAFDAALVTGGLPLICREWPARASVWEFLSVSLNDPTSALLVSAERSLAAEFPPRAMSGEILRAILEDPQLSIAPDETVQDNPRGRRLPIAIVPTAIVSLLVLSCLRPAREDGPAVGFQVDASLDLARAGETGLARNHLDGVRGG